MRQARFLSLALMILVLAFGSVIQAQDQITLRLMGHSSTTAEDQALAEAVAAFEEANPNINVEVQLVPEFDTVLQTAFASGDYPEVFYVNQDKVDEFAQAGVLAPATDLIEDVDDIYPSLVETFTYRDVFYCPAKDFSTLALEYNVDLFEQAGVELPTADWTWDDLRSAAETIQEETGTAGIVLAADIDRYLAFYVQAGGQLYDDEGNFSYAIGDDNYNAAVESLTFYAGLIQDGVATTPQALGAGWSGDAFGQGQAAMAIEGNWIIQYLLDTFPDLNWGVSELPQGPNGGQGTLVFSECYGVAADNQYPEESWLLVNFLTGREGAARVGEGGFGPMPARISAGELWTEARGEEFQPFVSGADYAVAPFLPPGFQEFRDTLGNAIAQTFEGQLSAEEAVDDARDVAEELLED